MSEKKICETDILVVGASLEGCMTAIALAERGSKVLLTEQSGSLGGAATNGLENYLPWELEQNPDVKILAERIWKEAGQTEGIVGPLYHDQKCKLVLKRMLDEAGVTVLTHVFPAEIFLSGEAGVICSMAVKTGRLEVHAKAVVDATAFGELAGIAGWDWQQSRDYITVAVKWNGISAEVLKGLLESGYEEQGNCLLGELRIRHSSTINGIFCESQSLQCYHNKHFGETILTGLQAHVNGVDSFMRSDAQAALRIFAYEFRDKLRAEVQGLEKASIIHVAPILNLYGLRTFRTQESQGLYVLNHERDSYSNLQAIRDGLTLAQSLQVVGKA